jgi:hypothetical protein
MDILTDFVNEISKFNLSIPLPIQISAYVIVGIIITALVYLFRDTLDASKFRDSYMWYYFIAIFNIVNICLVLWFYWSKSGTFIGPAGNTGPVGTRGDIGENMNCTLCSNNIYTVNTSRYDLITRVDFNGLAGVMIGPQLATGLKLADKVLQNDLFDYAEFSQSIINNTFDLKNEMTSTLFTLSVYNEFPLVNYINRNLGLSDSKTTGYFRRPFGKTGYFSIGDIAFGGSDTYKPSSQMVNGDVRCPTGFETICTFATTGDRGEIEKYSILKMIPPVLNQDATRDPKDITRKYKDDRYVALGHIVYYHKPTSTTTNQQLADPLLFACVKESCCKRLDPRRLKLVFVYPGAAAIDPANNKQLKAKIQKEVSEGSQPADAMSEGFFSVWRTPFNTMVTKFSNGGWVSGMRIVEYVYQNSPEIYNRDGSIKTIYRSRLEAFMEKIRLPKLVVACVVFAATIERIKLDIRDIVTEFVTGRGELAPTETLRKFETPEDTTIQDVSLAIADIAAAIDDLNAAGLKNTEKAMLKRDRLVIRTLAEADQPPEARKLGGRVGASYNLVKAYDRLKVVVTEMSIKIENSKSLLDVFTACFPDGLSTRLDTETLTPTLVNMLNLVAVLVPPQDDIWVIDNRCLVYEQLDETRLLLASNVEEEVKRFNAYVRDTSGDEPNMDAETLCGGSKNVETINKMVKETRDIITHQLGHIPDFMDKLNRSELDEMTNSNLEIILGQFRKLNEFINSRCSS